VDKIKIEQHTTSGSLWFAGWLFTIGFLHLSVGKGVRGDSVVALFPRPDVQRASLRPT